MIVEKSKILIIDDEEDICFVLNHYLNDKAHKVSYALSLKAGILKLKELRPEILFLDISLPDGSGLNSIKKIKKSCPEIKIAIISAYDSQEDLSKAMDAGADAYITKPFSRTIILKTIEDFLME